MHTIKKPLLLFFAALVVFPTIIAMVPFGSGKASALSTDKLLTAAKAWIVMQELANDGFKSPLMQADVDNFTAWHGGADCPVFAKTIPAGFLLSPGDGAWHFCSSADNRDDLIKPVLASMGYADDTSFVKALGYTAQADGSYTRPGGGNPDKNTISAVLFKSKAWDASLDKGDFNNGVAPGFVKYIATVDLLTNQASSNDCKAQADLFVAPQTKEDGNNNLWLVKDGTNKPALFSVQPKSNSDTSLIGRGLSVGEDSDGNITCGNVKGALLKADALGKHLADYYAAALGADNSQLSGSNSGSMPACTDDGNGNCVNNSDSLPDCGSSSLSWLVCPVIGLAGQAAEAIDSFITHQLDVDVKPIFKTSCTQGNPSASGDCSDGTNIASGLGFYKAWNSFRILATVVVVIAGLIMIASQALGFEFLDAYTIRKTLPRLLIAVIGISLSWPLMEFVVSFFNVLGLDIRGIMYAPFRSLQGTGTISVGVGLSSYLALGAAALALGFASLTLILTALLALFVGFIIIVIRLLALDVLVIIAPIAIACYVLPNTQKVWKLWKDNFLGLLLMFPIISAFIAAGHIFAALSFSSSAQTTGITQIIGIVAYFIPYFLLPVAFRLATGVIGTIAGFVNDRNKGVFDRLKKYRGNKTAQNMHAMKTGNRFKGDNFASNSFNASPRNLANLSNAGFRPGKMRSRMQAANVRHEASEMAEYMDKDAAFSVIKGNDDYLQATMENMGGGKKESDWRRYLSNQGYKGRDLEEGVASIRAAKRGVSNEVFERAAVMANASTGTGWKEGGPAAMMESINAVTGDDRHSAASMLAQMRGMAGQAGRLDLGGSGFGVQVSAMNAMYTPDKNGQVMTHEDANAAVIEGALFTKGPGEYARARGQAVQNMAPQMVKHLQNAHIAVEQARANGNADEVMRKERILAQEYAALDNLHDNLNHMAPENARIIADSVLSQEVTPGVTVYQNVQRMAQGGDAMGRAFLETRKSYDAKQYAAGENRPPEPEPPK